MSLFIHGLKGDKEIEIAVLTAAHFERAGPTATSSSPTLEAPSSMATMGWRTTSQSRFQKPERAPTVIARGLYGKGYGVSAEPPPVV